MSDLAIQIQRSNVTEYNRYPAIFDRVRRLCEERDQPGVNVLSFGCSTGEEVACLDAMYLTGCNIVGLDVSPEAIATAVSRVVPTGRNQIAFQTYEEFQAVSKAFYIVLVLSVLCRWPDAQGQANIRELYGFSDFARQLEAIDNLVEPGGVMVLHNTNYYPEDTPVIAAGYKPIHLDFTDIGFVTRFDTESTVYSNSRPGRVFFRKLTT